MAAPPTFNFQRLLETSNIYFITAAYKDMSKKGQKKLHSRHLCCCLHPQRWVLTPRQLWHLTKLLLDQSACLSCSQHSTLSLLDSLHHSQQRARGLPQNTWIKHTQSLSLKNILVHYCSLDALEKTQCCIPGFLCHSRAITLSWIIFLSDPASLNQCTKQRHAQKLHSSMP